MNKKLFGALALTVALGACTSEEELVISGGLDAQLANRPLIGQVEITAGPETRAVVNDPEWGQMKYVPGDAVGVALVDKVTAGAEASADGVKWSYKEYLSGTTKWTSHHGTTTFKGAEGEPADFYTLATGNDNIINTNYGYEYNGTSWNSEASLVEGHYMFYFPYNMDNSSRLPVKAIVPNPQDCSDFNSAIDAFYAGTNPVAVDVKFLEKPASGEKAKLSTKPVHLFAYPQITIKNNFNGYLLNGNASSTTAGAVSPTIKINKVELVYTGEDNTLWHSGDIDAGKLKDKLAAGWDANKFKNAAYTSQVINKADNGDYAGNVFPILNAAYSKVNVAAKDVIVCNLNAEIAAGNDYVFYAVVPAENYGTHLSVRMYATIGDKEYMLITRSGSPVVSGGTTSVTPGGLYTFNTPIQLVRGERYPAAEYTYNANGTTGKKENAGAAMTVELAGMDAYETKAYTTTPSTAIKNNAELIAQMTKGDRGVTIQEVVENGYNGAKNTFAIDEDDNSVVFNAELIAAMQNQLVYDGSVAMKLEQTNFVISGDGVNVKNNGLQNGTDYYEFELSADGKTVKVWYNKSLVEKDLVNSFLTSGVNIVTGADGTELKTSNANAVSGHAIAYLSDDKKYKISNGADKFEIILADNNEITVTHSKNKDADGHDYSGDELSKYKNIDCNALITTTKNSKFILERGGLSNANNVFMPNQTKNGVTTSTTFVNNGLRKISAALGSENTVKAVVPEWPSKVDANTKIQEIEINSAAVQNSFEITEQMVESFGVDGIKVTLGGNYKVLKSAEGIDLRSTKISQFVGAAGTKWRNANATGTVVISHYNGQIVDIVESNTNSNFGRIQFVSYSK